MVRYMLLIYKKYNHAVLSKLNRIETMYFYSFRVNKNKIGLRNLQKEI